MTSFVNLTQHGPIALITVDNPPVNALSQAVRAGLLDTVKSAAEGKNKAIVLICAGRTFFAGADISEFGKPPADPWLPELVNQIESSPIPVIAAIHGTALRRQWPVITELPWILQSWVCLKLPWACYRALVEHSDHQD